MTRSSFVLVLLCCLCCFLVTSSAARAKPVEGCAECNMDMGELMEDKGFTYKKFMIPSADGMLQLNMYRLINEATNSTKGPPVILQHGLEDCGASFVINERFESLGFILADAGFDVWISNSRGNTYSPCETDACWRFSFDEMALYDMPTFIDFVLNATGRKKVSWVGHSQGTTQAFASFATLPKTAEKVNLFVALAPVATVTHQSAALLTFLADLHVASLFEVFGVKDFLPSTPITRAIAQLFCAPGDLTTPVCEDIFFALMGKDPQLDGNLNSSRIDVYTSHSPAGTSVQNMAHWAQLVRTPGLHMFDYGEKGNFIHYGQATPPAYDVSKITVPTAFFAGGQDALADPVDFQNLLGVYKKDAIVSVDIQDDYDHIDFVWGMDAHIKIYPKIAQLLKKFA